MKYIISPQQVQIMQKLNHLGVHLTGMSAVSGISYSHIRAAAKNGRSSTSGNSCVSSIKVIRKC